MPLSTLNGLTIHNVPTTTETIKLAAPINSPTANSPAPALIAVYVPNKSGDPFPNARNVTPARFSSRRRREESVERLGQKKSEEEMPRVVKRKRSQVRRVRKMMGRVGSGEQK